MDKKQWHSDVVGQQTDQQADGGSRAGTHALMPADKRNGDQRHPGDTTDDQRRPGAQRLPYQQRRRRGRSKQKPEAGDKLDGCDGGQ